MELKMFQAAVLSALMLVGLTTLSACKDSRFGPPTQTREEKRAVERKAKEPAAREAVVKRMAMPPDVAAALVPVETQGPCYGFRHGEQLFWVKFEAGEANVSMSVGQRVPIHCAAFGAAI